MGPRYSANDLFSSKLICEDCGGFYGRKKWHSGSNYEKFVYQCNNKFHKGKDKCLTPHLNQEDIKEKFIKAYNLTMEAKRRIIDDAKEVIELLTDTSKIDEEIVKINDESAIKWLNNGAKPTDTVDMLFKNNGIYEKRNENK